MTAPTQPTPKADSDEGPDSRVRWPDFLIIGAAKSGSSSLYHYMVRHPKIYDNWHKEPYFFVHEHPIPAQRESYLKLFAGVPDDHLCGEASTPYTRWPQVKGVPRRIYEVIPDVKLIYLLRHPVDRAYSQYVHRTTKELYKQKRILVTFEEHLESDSTCFDSSLYLQQIEQYLQWFPRASILPVLSDELRSDPRMVLRRVFQFLQVDDSVDVSGQVAVEQNQTKLNTRDLASAAVADNFKQKIPGYRYLRHLLPGSFRQRVYLFLRDSQFGKKHQRAYTPAPMRPETRKALLDRYREPNRSLAAFLNIDLSHWSV